jgi:hypothetical protein
VRDPGVTPDPCAPDSGPSHPPPPRMGGAVASATIGVSTTHFLSRPAYAAGANLRRESRELRRQAGEHRARARMCRARAASLHQQAERLLAHSRQLVHLSRPGLRAGRTAGVRGGPGLWEAWRRGLSWRLVAMLLVLSGRCANVATGDRRSRRHRVRVRDMARGASPRPRDRASGSRSRTEAPLGPTVAETSCAVARPECPSSAPPTPSSPPPLPE